MNVSAWVEQSAKIMQDAGLVFGHGTENAYDEAAWLVLTVLGLHADEELPGTEVGDEHALRIESLLEQRISTRAPLAYLLGEAWFCGLRFEVDEHVLVPRSPIAELINSSFRPWLEPESIGQVLDLCTGSGALAVATALALPQANLVASDISATALSVAQRNCRLHSVDDRIDCVLSDLFVEIPQRGYDLILSNPPYVAQNVFNDLPSEYHAEPELALISAGGGLEIPLRIMADASDYLASGGFLVCEVGESAEALHSALPGVPLTWVEFMHGGDGVFIMDREELVMHRSQIETLREELNNVL